MFSSNGHYAVFIKSEYSLNAIKDIIRITGTKDLLRIIETFLFRINNW